MDDNEKSKRFHDEMIASGELYMFTPEESKIFTEAQTAARAFDLESMTDAQWLKSMHIGW